MKNTELERLKRKRSKLFEQLTRLDGWTTGSLVTTERKCNNRRYPFHYLSRSVSGSNKITYVATGELEEWKKMLHNGKKARELFDRITDLSIAILKHKQKKELA